MLTELERPMTITKRTRNILLLVMVAVVIVIYWWWNNQPPPIPEDTHAIFPTLTPRASSSSGM